MRIAYIAPYQGPELVRRRPIIRNLRIAANVKIALIGQLFQSSSHPVEIPVARRGDRTAVESVCRLSGIGKYRREYPYLLFFCPAAPVF